MVSYFCTCGRGTEIFLVEEIKRNFVVDKINQIDGKVYFKLSDEIHHEGYNSFDATLCLRNENLKASDIPTLKVQHGSLQPMCTTGGSENKLKCYDLSEKFNKQSSMQLKNDHKKLLQLKCSERLFVSILRDSKITKSNYQRTVSQLKAVLYHIEASNWLECHKAWQALQPESFEQDIDDIPKDQQHVVPGDEEIYTRCISEKSTACSDEPVSKRLKLSYNDSDRSVSFRVSAKCCGSLSRVLTSQELSRMAGPIISKQTGWKVNLKKPDLEVFMQLNDYGLVIGIPVTKAPLSKRPYLRHCGLRTTVAAAMVSLASLKPGMCVLDPMCGQGTILVEAAKQYPNCYYWGTDVTVAQCVKAAENARYSAESHRINIVHTSVATLPFRERSFDAAVCDIPFGIQHGTPEQNRKLYPQIISNLDRILKPGAKVVLLVGTEMKNTLLGVVDSVTHQSNNPLESGFRSHEGIQDTNLIYEKLDTVNCTSSSKTDTSTSGPDSSKCHFNKEVTENDFVKDSGLDIDATHSSTDAKSLLHVNESCSLGFCGSNGQDVSVDSTNREQLNSNTEKDFYRHISIAASRDLNKQIYDNRSVADIAVDSASCLSPVSKTDITKVDVPQRIGNRCQLPKYIAQDVIESNSEITVQKSDSNVEEDNQQRTGSKSSEGNTITSCDSSRWTRQLVHYVKLGETHAYICVFTKTL